MSNGEMSFYIMLFSFSLGLVFMWVGHMHKEKLKKEQIQSERKKYIIDMGNTPTPPLADGGLLVPEGISAESVMQGFYGVPIVSDDSVPEVEIRVQGSPEELRQGIATISYDPAEGSDRSAVLIRRGDTTLVDRVDMSGIDIEISQRLAEAAARSMDEALMNGLTQSPAPPVGFRDGVTGTRGVGARKTKIMKQNTGAPAKEEEKEHAPLRRKVRLRNN